jgi:hypothetical protein
MNVKADSIAGVFEGLITHYAVTAARVDYEARRFLLALNEAYPPNIFTETDEQAGSQIAWALRRRLQKLIAERKD